MSPHHRGPECLQYDTKLRDNQMSRFPYYTPLNVNQSQIMEDAHLIHTPWKVSTSQFCGLIFYKFKLLDTIDMFNLKHEVE